MKRATGPGSLSEIDLHVAGQLGRGDVRTEKSMRKIAERAHPLPRLDGRSSQQRNQEKRARKRA